MSKRMLVDGAHAEETRVVVMSGDQLTEYDIETNLKKQIRGNIYLAKVVRVEPSLQAAFVEFGGNRHGFLALSDIHPDYYQIPIEDRQRLMEEQKELELEARAAREHLEDLDVGTDEDEAEEKGSKQRKSTASDGDVGSEEGETAEAVEDEDPGSDEPARTAVSRQYKIQEVIKRRQILLVQVAKEERGNKGAALTTYISLAGRCCVLMPNTSRGGGISRRINSVKERRKLRDILESLNIPEGIGVIIRTAGGDRSKGEIRRDFEYLLKVWDHIRETTLASTAPCLIHEEADIIKRAIRDVYSRDVTEILVEGPDAYRRAKEFMRLMMPSHAKRVQPFREEATNLFQTFGIEEQLDAMYRPEVPLESGGYLVINQTEALVAIDVNSGQSTRERSIERTALNTNIEAADEIARQLRLRDLAGLIVIDFIDMEENRNIRKVERRFREAAKSDRARLQVGQISEFGLLELSRQRLRPSLIETSTQLCQHCSGTGVVLSTEVMALRVLRSIEKEGGETPNSDLTIVIPPAVALYILNHKRNMLSDIEARHGLTVVLQTDDTVALTDVAIERSAGTGEPARSESRTGARTGVSERRKAGQSKGEEPRSSRRRRDRRKAIDEEGAASSENTPVPASEAREETGTDGGTEGQGRRRRRSRRRKSGEEPAPVTTQTGDESPTEAATGEGSGEETGRRRRRRRRSRKSAGEPERTPRDDAHADLPTEKLAPDTADAGTPLNATATPQPDPGETGTGTASDDSAIGVDVMASEEDVTTPDSEDETTPAHTASPVAGEAGPVPDEVTDRESEIDPVTPTEAAWTGPERSGIGAMNDFQEDEASSGAKTRVIVTNGTDGNSIENQEEPERHAGTAPTSPDADGAPSSLGNGSAIAERDLHGFDTNAGENPEGHEPEESGERQMKPRGHDDDGSDPADEAPNLPEETAVTAVQPPERPSRSKRSGWWQRSSR